jgi:hypothetical protein
MADDKIFSVQRTTNSFSRGARRREQRLFRAMEARRGLSSSGSRGRAWINGREVGGENSRFAHLSRSYD